MQISTDNIQLPVSVGAVYAILQDKVIANPTTETQTINPSAGYNGLSSVQIKPMPKGTEGTPVATLGEVTNHSITITPSVTNSAGYIEGTTKTGEPVTVKAEDLVSGTKTITANGLQDVANYSLANVAVTDSLKTQVSNSNAKITNKTTLTDTGITLTVSQAGSYTVYWSAFRNDGTTGYTWGTQLYINGTAYGTESTSWAKTNNQSIRITGVRLRSGDSLSVYGRTRSGSSYFLCCSNLVIVQTS